MDDHADGIFQSVRAQVPEPIDSLNARPLKDETWRQNGMSAVSWGTIRSQRSCGLRPQSPPVCKPARF